MIHNWATTVYIIITKNTNFLPACEPAVPPWTRDIETLIETLFCRLVASHHQTIIITQYFLWVNFHFIHYFFYLDFIFFGKILSELIFTFFLNNIISYIIIISFKLFLLDKTHNFLFQLYITRLFIIFKTTTNIEIFSSFYFLHHNFNELDFFLDFHLFDSFNILCTKPKKWLNFNDDFVNSGWLLNARIYTQNIDFFLMKCLKYVGTIKFIQFSGCGQL